MFRPLWPGPATTIHQAAPGRWHPFRHDAPGLRLAEGPRAHQARPPGWHHRRQIGEALNLVTVAEERGLGLDEAALGCAAGAEHAQPFETLSFGWTCPSSGGFVRDRGPGAGPPEDAEPGHAGGWPPPTPTAIASASPEDPAISAVIWILIIKKAASGPCPRRPTGKIPGLNVLGGRGRAGARRYGAGQSAESCAGSEGSEAGVLGSSPAGILGSIFWIGGVVSPPWSAWRP